MPCFSFLSLLALATSAAASYTPTPSARPIVTSQSTPAPCMTSSHASRLVAELAHARAESSSLRNRLGVCLSSTLSVAPLPITGFTTLPVAAFQRAATALVHAVLSFLAIFTATKRQVEPTIHNARLHSQRQTLKVERERLMPKQQASLDLWLNQYQRTRELCTRPTHVATTAVATQRPNAPVAAQAPPSRPKAAHTTPHTQSWSQSLVASTKVAPAPAPPASSTSSPPSSMWQQQGLAGTAAAKRKAEAVDSFLNSFQRNRLGGR